MMKRSKDRPGLTPSTCAIAIVIAVVAGCQLPSAHVISRNFGRRGDVPVDPPRTDPQTHYDDCIAGGRLFKLYCGSCHNARPLGERPFSNYQVAIAHMRDQAYLTGKEYRQIIMFLRRWDDIGPPTPATGPSPKRFVFSQPIPELRPEMLETVPPPPPGGSPFQPQGAPGAPPSQPPKPLD
jgi:hypothetical protein